MVPSRDEKERVSTQPVGTGVGSRVGLAGRSGRGEENAEESPHAKEDLPGDVVDRLVRETDIGRA